MNVIIWIILAGVFHMALGMFWYSSALFWKIWCKAKWFIHEDMQNKKMPLNALWKAIANALFIAVVLKWSVNILWFTTLEQSISFAVIAGILISTNEISKYIWEQEKFILVPLNSLFTIFAYAWMVSIMFYI